MRIGPDGEAWESVMGEVELRDPEEARRFVLQGLWLQRAAAVSAESVPAGLDWALAVAAAGQPLPPPGFVADLGHLLLPGWRRAPEQAAAPSLPSVPAGLLRTYEDHVLGKLYADRSVERAADALARYPAPDQARGLAFVVGQYRERAGFDAAWLSPGVIKSLRELAAEEVLAQGFDELQQGLMPLLAKLYESLLAGCRRLADALGPEDLFELEHGTALAEPGQRLALRQVLEATQRLLAGLPRHRPRSRGSAPQVPTTLAAEDVFPVGGYASLANRGSIESLLHSQLAFMEPDRPDLFDIKYLRDELLYYARDENHFWRPRRRYRLLLWPDLAQARFKDPALPWQRIILLLALIHAAVTKLIEWLQSEALTFELVLVEESGPSPLSHEEELLRTLFREQIMARIVTIERQPAGSLTVPGPILSISVQDRAESEGENVARLLLDRPTPTLWIGDETIDLAGLDPVEHWSGVLEVLLAGWV
jgi:hypothetical protein